MLGVNICKSNIFTASVYSTPNTIQYLHYTPRANICMSSSYSPFFEIKGNFASLNTIFMSEDGMTAWRTDRPDRRNDRPTEWLIESRARDLKLTCICWRSFARDSLTRHKIVFTCICYALCWKIVFTCICYDLCWKLTHCLIIRVRLKMADMRKTLEICAEYSFYHLRGAIGTLHVHAK